MPEMSVTRYGHSGNLETRKLSILWGHTIWMKLDCVICNLYENTSTIKCPSGFKWAETMQYILKYRKGVAD